MLTPDYPLVVAFMLISGAVGVSEWPAAAQEADALVGPGWENGSASDDPGFFPIAVWLQDPDLAERYKQAGINGYVGLWQGPTEAKLKTLRDAGMWVICEQNGYARTLLERDDPLLGVVVGWQQQDEPDNAQRKQGGGGYGPPVPPEEMVERYEAMHAADGTRPVFLNLSQGVAWDGWHGRGERTGHLEDYPEYVKAADIVSFDIYPVAHDKPAVQGKLWYVPRGVERLREWTGGRKPVWNCIEASRVKSDHRPTPDQIRAEVWMSIIHGSTGLIYFVHEWTPDANADSLLDHPETLQGVTRVNAEVRGLAPVINSPTVVDGATVEAVPSDAPVAVMVKRHGGDIYLFTVEMRGQATDAKFEIAGVAPGASVEVLGEARELKLNDGGVLDDHYEPYAVHLYRIAGR